MKANFQEFTGMDWDAYAGAVSFANANPEADTIDPMIASTETAVIIIDGHGILFQLEEGQSLVLMPRPGREAGKWWTPAVAEAVLAQVPDNFTAKDLIKLGFQYA